MATTAIIPAGSELSDEQAVERVLAGDIACFEILMRRYNQRLYRVARAIVRDDHEAEDVMQDAYVRAYQHLEQFAGRARFSTWLTRIAVHEALARVQRSKRFRELEPSPEHEGDPMTSLASDAPSPEQCVSASELARLLERSIEKLPQKYRMVFIMREVEELSTEETAGCLEITEESVKTRLHRARALLRKDLYRRAGATSFSTFQFHAARCDRVVKCVFERLSEQQ